MRKTIKICGINQDPKHLAKLDVDYLGFVFYPKSPRALQLQHYQQVLQCKAKSKFGVFVNQPRQYILQQAQLLGLDYLQLHGNETPQDCEFYTLNNLKVIKAICLENPKDLQQTKVYEPYCQGFVFDTKSPLYGGSGKSFNWSIVEYYNGDLPFLLSGGLGLNNIKQALQINHPKLQGFDLNSKLEISPGIKDLKKTIEIIKLITDE